MMLARRPLASASRALLAGLAFCCATGELLARPTSPKGPPSPPPLKAAVAKHSAIDDSTRLRPTADLALPPSGQRRADALANFVEGSRLEESGELDAALAAYQKVLTVDPGEMELASRVASLLVRQEDFPRAIDILKDAVKAKPKEAVPYLQLAVIYAKYLQKTVQAVNYANRAIDLEPDNIDAYQRLYEIELASGSESKALAALDRAAKVESKDAAFWTHLGKLYAAHLFKIDTEPRPEDLQRVNKMFNRAAEFAGDDVTVVKDIADYFAASQQLQQAIPLYLRVLELEPEDANAREKLATGFVLTNQRPKAIDMLHEIIAAHPERYQPYELLAQLLDDEARDLLRADQPEAAKAEWAKAAAAYEQSSLINPNRAQTYLRLGELLLGSVNDSARAERIVAEGRARFPQAPEFTYLLALAQREAKHPQQAVATFEEALHEAEGVGSSILNGRFYFDYGAAAEQAGLFDKAADLLRQSVVLDPASAAEVYNYLGFMWAEHNMHLAEAEEMINKALQLDAENGAYLDSLGWVKFRRGRFEDALRDLLRAAQLMKKDDPTVFDHIADTYAKLGRIPQALEFWQKAIALAPENKAVAEKIESTKTKLSQGEPSKGNPVP